MPLPGRWNAGPGTASRASPVPGSPPPHATVRSTGSAVSRRAPPSSGRPRCSSPPTPEPRPGDESGVTDDRLRLIFTCCHPALSVEAQVALTLRTLAGLTTARDRPGLPRARADDGAAAGAGEAQDPRCRHPVPGATGAPAAGAHERGAGGALPALQRGLLRVGGCRPAAARRLRARRSGSAARWRSSCPTSRRRSDCSR